MRAVLTPRPRLAVLAAAALALTLAACGGDDDPDPQATTAPPTTAAPTSGAPTPTVVSSTSSCPLRTSPAPGTTVVTASVTGKDVTAPDRSVSVKLGTRVRLEVTTDVADELHVHTYDVKEATTPGCPTALEFVANIPASVEVELEKAHVHVLEIKAS